MSRYPMSEEQRQAILREIRPGWLAMEQQNWIPKGTKPTLELFKKEIIRRSELHVIPIQR